MEEESGNAFAADAKKNSTGYEEARAAVKEFKEALQDVTQGSSGSRGYRPVVVIIDELDRCRPSYAVELLEAAKHLFSVDGILFVLGVNRSQLAHSVTALYGGGFDANGYLRRFVDLEFRLPEPGRAQFVESDTGCDPDREVLSVGHWTMSMPSWTAGRAASPEMASEVL